MNEDKTGREASRASLSGLDQFWHEASEMGTPRRLFGTYEDVNCAVTIVGSDEAHCHASFCDGFPLDAGFRRDDECAGAGLISKDCPADGDLAGCDLDDDAREELVRP